MTEDNDQLSELDKWLAWHRDLARVLSDSYRYPVDHDEFDLDCERRIEVGWVADDEDCSKGNLTQDYEDHMLSL